jgi:hypothetical protein
MQFLHPGHLWHNPHFLPGLHGHIPHLEQFGLREHIKIANHTTAIITTATKKSLPSNIAIVCDDLCVMVRDSV